MGLRGGAGCVDVVMGQRVRMCIGLEVVVAFVGGVDADQTLGRAWLPRLLKGELSSVAVW